MEKQSLKLCVMFLEEISRLTCTVVLEICAEQCNLNEKVHKNSLNSVWLEGLRSRIRKIAVSLKNQSNRHKHPSHTVFFSCLVLCFSYCPNTVLRPSAQRAIKNWRNRYQRKETFLKRNPGRKASGKTEPSSQSMYDLTVSIQEELAVDMKHHCSPLL